MSETGDQVKLIELQLHAVLVDPAATPGIKSRTARELPTTPLREHWD